MIMPGMQQDLRWVRDQREDLPLASFEHEEKARPKGL
jgi:hypothetical protein